jgi:hypothetical protein
MMPINPIESRNIDLGFAEQFFQRFTGTQSATLPPHSDVTRVGNLAGATVLLGMFSMSDSGPEHTHQGHNNYPHPEWP